MIWSAIERCIQHYLNPFAVDAYRAKKLRGNFNVQPVKQGNVRNLFIDISVIIKHDAGTGIQRVTRSISYYLFSSPPMGWTVTAVCADRKCPYHVTINRWTNNVPQPNGAYVLNARPGDVFLGLDYATDNVYRYRKQLTKFKQSGGHVWFLVHDLLPIQNPEWFSDKAVIRHRRWLQVIASLADGFFCNSSHTLETLRLHLLEKYRLNSGYRSVVLPMGWELGIGRHSKDLPEGYNNLLQRLQQHPTVLMVGTLEPRKGHTDVLAAFDRLWGEGRRYNLLIVGKPGWKTDKLQAYLRGHSQRGKHLFWLDNACDETLDQLYAICNGVIVASLAEGYGLPLTEALGHGKFVLARDIPVFRRHRSNSISFFPADADSSILSHLIHEWIESLEVKPRPGVQEILPTWRDSAEAIMKELALM